MSDPYIGEIQMFGFDFPPRDWAFCAGGELSISQNTALYSLIGTIYGGDGRNKFCLPDLRGRMTVHPVNTFYASQLGLMNGGETSTLAISDMPSHTHQLMATSAPGDWIKPIADGMLAQSTEDTYIQVDNNLSAMHPYSISDNGASQPHNNMQPCMALNFCIALQGNYPSRD
jgi:microcystin-dependent protein